MQNASGSTHVTENVVFVSGRAREDSDLTEKFCSLLAKLASTEDRHNIYLPTSEDLSEWDVVIAAWECGGKIVSGLYTLRMGPGQYYLGGVISDIAFRNKGLSRRLVKFVIASLSNIGPCVINLDVRIRQGKLNIPAYELFVANGFEINTVKLHELGSNNFERHLYEYAEAGGKFIRSLRMHLQVGSAVEGIAA